MITFSNPIALQLGSGNIKYFFLVTINNMHYTNAPFNITMSNGITYFSDGGLSGVEPPRLSSSVDRASYRVIFSDSQFQFRSLFEEGITGKPIEVRVGFFNALFEEILDSNNTPVDTGQIFYDIRDSFLSYRGVVDTYSYSIDPNESVTVVIEGSSPMADLDLVRSFYTNKDTLNQYDSTDNSFDKVHEGSGVLKLRWGKQ
jgi:hypothetical protein